VAPADDNVNVGRLPQFPESSGGEIFHLPAAVKAKKDLAITQSPIAVHFDTQIAEGVLKGAPTAFLPPM